VGETRIAVGSTPRGAFSQRLEACDNGLKRVTAISHTRTLLASLFAIALILRVTYAFIAVEVDPILSGDPLNGDAASYDRIARSLLDGTGFTSEPPQPSAFWPPAYPGMLAGIYWVFGYELIAGRLVNALLGALVPVVMFLLAARLFDRRVALLAALASAVHPLLVVVGVWLTADGPFVLMVCLTLLLMLMIQKRPTVHRLLLLGILLGIAFLLKPVAGFFFPLLVPWFLLSLPQPRLRQRFVAGALTLAALVVVLTPWTVRNQVVMGSPVVGSTNGGYTFYGANNPNAWGGHDEYFPPRIPGLSEVEEQREYYRRGLEWIRSDPGAFMRLEVKKFQRLASPLSVSSQPQDLSVPGESIIRGAYMLFLALVILGIVVLRTRWRTTGLLAIPMVAVLISTAIFYGDTRYTMPAIPSLLLWASVALVTLWDNVVHRAAR
jgi:4-amino-4-deoxy-L-arabinose transferase-like glycosyltransferase